MPNVKNNNSINAKLNAYINKLVQNVSNTGNTKNTTNNYTNVEVIRENIKDYQSKETRLKELGYKINVIEILDNDISGKDRYYINIVNEDGYSFDIKLSDYYKLLEGEEEKVELYLLKKIQSISGDISSMIADEFDSDTTEFINLLRNVISMKVVCRESYSYDYKDIGWNWKKGVFLYNKVIKCVINTEEIEEEKEESYSVVADDSAVVRNMYRNDICMKEEFSDEIIDMMNTLLDRPKAALLLAAGISGIVRQMLPFTKETNIYINILGKPHCGKTTMENIILYMFGEAEDLMGSFASTDKGIEIARVSRSIIPYIVDDAMLKHETEGKKKAYNILVDIFNQYEGKIHQSAFSSSRYSEDNISYGAFISSSVDSIRESIKEMRDVGQYRRFTEIEVEASELFKDGQEAKKFQGIAENNKGFMIFQFVKNIMINHQRKSNSVDCIYKIFEHRYLLVIEECSYSDEIKNELRTISQRIALIATSLYLLKETIYFYKVSDEEWTSKLKRRYSYKGINKEILYTSSENIDIYATLDLNRIINLMVEECNADDVMVAYISEFNSNISLKISNDEKIAEEKALANFNYCDLYNKLVDLLDKHLDLKQDDSYVRVGSKNITIILNSISKQAKYKLAYIIMHEEDKFTKEGIDELRNDLKNRNYIFNSHKLFNEKIEEMEGIGADKNQGKLGITFKKIENTEVK